MSTDRVLNAEYEKGEASLAAYLNACAGRRSGAVAIANVVRRAVLVTAPLFRLFTWTRWRLFAVLAWRASTFTTRLATWGLEVTR